MCSVNWNFCFICFVCRRMDNSKMHCERNNLLSFLSTWTSTQIETYFTSLLCGCQCLSDCESLTCKLCRVVSLHNTCTHMYTQTYTAYVVRIQSCFILFLVFFLFSLLLSTVSILYRMAWVACVFKQTHAPIHVAVCVCWMCRTFDSDTIFYQNNGCVRLHSNRWGHWCVVYCRL